MSCQYGLELISPQDVMASTMDDVHTDSPFTINNIAEVVKYEISPCFTCQNITFTSFTPLAIVGKKRIMRAILSNPFPLLQYMKNLLIGLIMGWNGITVLSFQIDVNMITSGLGDPIILVTIDGNELPITCATSNSFFFIFIYYQTLYETGDHVGVYAENSPT
ncbi:hypothetical protein ACJX0J_041350 [Zea mays]